MTRERAIQIMSNYDLNFYEVNEKIFDPGEVAEAFDLAIKALEAEDVLDKIRAEINEYKSIIDNAISEDELKIEGIKEAYEDCLEIIDKYKAESEDKA